jgi:short-subunit dehydrogenase
MKNNKNKIAIITGATSGIGAEYAQEYAQLGYNLLITGRREQKLEAFAEDLKYKYNVNITPVVCDFSSDSSLELLFKELEKLSQVEILVNNAGFGTSESFLEAEFTTHETMLKVHIEAVIKITYLIIPKMIANKGGSIINVSSFAAFTPAATSILYNSTKAFQISFSENLHLSLQKYNINVQALCPGFTQTDFHNKVGLKPVAARTKHFVKWMTPKFVVTESLKALSDKSHVVCVPGISYQLFLFVLRMIPKALYYRMVSAFAK